MLRKLYVTTKAYGGKWETVDGIPMIVGGNPRLMGILTELEKGKYQFEYKLGGMPVRERQGRLTIDEFPDIRKIYTSDNGNEVENFIYRIIPREDDFYAKASLKSAKLTEYDVWELLKVFGLRNMREDAYLHEVLPKGTTVYE